MVRTMKASGLALFLIILLVYAADIAYADNALIKRKDVQLFMQRMIKKHHFKHHELITLLQQIKIRPQIKKQINKPLEKGPWDTYQMLFISEWRIQHGVKFWNKHAETLKKAEKLYGVPAAIIVATLGIETKYGQRMGGHRVIDALGNLAFSNSARKRFFQSELENFLILTRKHHLDPIKVMGSYAGAIGQPQFMPSSYLNYGINFSNSGKVDLINNVDDVIGSIAYYYYKHGWQSNKPVAVRAYMIGQRYTRLVQKNKTNRALTLTQLSSFGVIPKYKANEDKALAKVIELPSALRREYWLGFHNFDVIKRYNSSNLYAMAVYQLSNYITELREKLNHE